MTEATPLRRNLFAVTSLLLGAMSLLFSLTAPVPFIPLISLFAYPLGFGAIVAGWAGGRRAKTAGDLSGASQARWGVRLGCLSWIIEATTRVITTLILAGLFVAAIKTWQGSH